VTLSQTPVSVKSASLSVVVPVHNEAPILVDQVHEMIGGLRNLGHPFELLLIENGSTDKTATLCTALASKHPEIRVIQVPVGDYGVALKRGILAAKEAVVVIFNVEFWSLEFVNIALTALETRTMVIGSKSAPGAHDDRPFIRSTITRTYNQLLRLVWGFDGTDTHGMKAFWREPLLPIVTACVTAGFVFDTELVLRAQRAAISKLELPTDVRELRPPSSGALARRVPSVLRNLLLLARSVPVFRRLRGRV